MFGIGIGEMLIICLVALLAFGPEKLPEVIRTIAKLMAQLRMAQNELRYSIMNAETHLRQMPLTRQEKEAEEPKSKVIEGAVSKQESQQNENRP